MRPKHVALVVVAVVATVAAVVFAALYFTTDSGSDSTATAEPCEGRMFGHISSLTRKGEQYELRFDPSLLTSGETANTAAAEDGKVEPGEPVPNDNYEIDEGHRTFMYLVPSEAAVTVLTNGGTGGTLSTPVTVSELEELLAGGKPVELFEPLSTGFWMRYHVDTVCTLDQQYKP